MVSERGVVIVGTIVGIRGDSRGAGWRTSDYDDATTGVVTMMHDSRTKDGVEDNRTNICWVLGRIGVHRSVASCALGKSR